MTEKNGPRRPYTIQPAEYRPPELEPRPRQQARPKTAPPPAPSRSGRLPKSAPSKPLPRKLYWLLPLAAISGFSLIWLASTLRAVELKITPPPDRVAVSGFTMVWGQLLLARPGEYRLSAKRRGYQPLTAAITVPRSGPARLSYRLQPLPGLLDISSEPPGAEVSLNGETAGLTPLKALPLAAGDHELLFAAEAYQTLRHKVHVEGFGQVQEVAVALQPKAPVDFSSRPPGAEIGIDGKLLGKTPATVGLDAGRHEVTISLAGYRPWSAVIEVTGGEAQTVPEVELQKALASVRIESEPTGAGIVASGRRQGQTPLTIAVEPDVSTEIILTHPGYHNLRNVVRVPANTVHEMHAVLTPIRGEVAITIEPPDAHVFAGGHDLGPASRVFRLPAVETDLIFRKSGYVDEKRTVTPDPDRRLELQVTLESDLAARLRQLPEWIDTGDGQRFRLITPGRFVMGAPRGQQGRRANEVERQVELTRPFYLADREVTNARFRAFHRDHTSGVAGDKTLDNEQQPVVNVTWDDAAAYCNWLSERDGLKPVYRNAGGRYELIRPVPNGYRLPSEAEWAMAARFAGGREAKYPWNGNMPPAKNAGNFADRSARGLLPAVLPDYDDGWAASAPVGSYPANELGLYDIGGNVSEWIGDYYAGGLIATPVLERDPLGPNAGAAHVVRGSSWRHSGLTELRLSWRDQAVQGRDDLGFRIARYAE